MSYIIYIVILQATTFFCIKYNYFHSHTSYEKQSRRNENSITHNSLQKSLPPPQKKKKTQQKQQQQQHTNKPKQNTKHKQTKRPSTFIYSISRTHTLICNITHTDSHQHLHTRAHTHTRTHAHTHTHTHTHIYTHIHTHTHAHTRTHTHAYLQPIIVDQISNESLCIIVLTKTDV